MIDWSVGEYEDTAVHLAPVAERLVEVVGPASGARLLDVGCGTGSAALAAARAGGRAVGVDPARRLIDVAAATAADEGLDVEFVVGDACDLPFEDASFDLAVSNFAVIFAPDADASVGELLRVLRPRGRAAISAWSAGNPLDAALGAVRQAVADLMPAPPGPRFAWSDEDAVHELFERRGARLRVERGTLAFEADSAEEYVARNERHPIIVAARAALERAGRYEEVRGALVRALEDRNEDPGGFRVASRYYVLVAQLPG